VRECKPLAVGAVAADAGVDESVLRSNMTRLQGGAGASSHNMLEIHLTPHPDTRLPPPAGQLSIFSARLITLQYFEPKDIYYWDIASSFACVFVPILVSGST
jgi:hypothetical protein